MTNKIYLLSSNQGKIDAANLVFKKYGIEVLPLELDVAEIQAATSQEIARAMAVEAHKLTGKPVIREDHSFYIDELGFPGPFMAYTDKTISVEQLLKIVDTLKCRDAHFELAATYVDESGKAHDFSYTVPVVIGKEIKGTDKLRWERLMMFKGDSKTFAELDKNEHAEVWTNNYKDIAKLIRNNSLLLDGSAIGFPC
ncbi:MAG TPA: non-canonical purine NTP pyrophosphatase [Candidatus Saccharimonadales bacterium]|nr:non-canonical purine NTP pyrophosphatase [Candidatus Saccharimonadales bacterium]